METLRRFTNNTRVIVCQLAPAGFFTRWILPFATGFLFGTYRLPAAVTGGYSVRFALPPAALAFLDAVLTTDRRGPISPPSLSAAAGAALGSLAGGNLAGCAAALLLFACVSVISSRRRLLNVEHHAVLLAVSLLMLPLGIPLRAWQEFTSGTVLIHILGTGVTVLFALVETAALGAFSLISMKRPVSDALSVSTAVFAGLIAAAFQTARPLGIGLGAVFAALFCMTAAKMKGIGGVSLAAIVAVMRVISTNGDLLLIAVLCTCTLSACLFSGLGKWGTAAGFAVPAIAFYAVIHGTGTLRIAEILLALALFLLLPQRLFEPADRTIRPGRDDRAEKRLLYQNYKLTTLSDVLSRVALMFESGEQPADGYINRQLTGVADSLARLSEGSGPAAGHGKKARFGLDFGAACCPKKGCEEAGDSLIIRDFDGVYLAAISDGMGSGAEAKRESSQAVQLLADLVTCGFRLDEASECVNRLLLLREGGEMYATLDAILFDPQEGSISIAKHGAPASYIIRSGLVSTLYSEALPVGIIADAKASVCSFRIKKGDTIVMMSDGAADALGDSLVPLLEEHAAGEDARLSARLIAELAFQMSGGADDASVIVARAE